MDCYEKAAILVPFIYRFPYISMIPFSVTATNASFPASNLPMQYLRNE